MKVGYLITGRLKSTRLPKKLLLEIEGKSVITHMIDRLKQAKKIDEIIICTSTNEQDKPLGEIAKNNNIQCYFGDPDDVLLRLLSAADEFGLDYILNITADCPFADPYYADKIVEKYIETNADFIRQFDLPHGAFSYGIKVNALRKVVELKNSSDTEVWGRYFTDTGLFNVLDLDVEDPHHFRPGLRMTLDYPEDFEFFNAIFQGLYENNKVFSLTEILTFLDEHPEVIKINKDCGATFKKRFLSQSEPKLKKTNKVKKALIIGSGSIGQRHIRNLKKIGISDIIALRSKKGHYKKLPKELEVTEVDNWDDAINQNPDIAIIANPTSLHLEAAIKIAPYVKGIMIEKPLSHSLEDCQRLIELLNNNNVVSFIGHNIMFHPIVKNIQKFVDENTMGEIINIQCQVGQWLPDWHPYEDYTKAYYAKKELGGGVALTLIHEIHLALEFAGLPSQVMGMVSDYKELDLDVDVCSDLMIKHQTGAVSQIHLDYIQKPAHRSGLLTFESGWMSYDFSGLNLLAQRTEDKTPQTVWSGKDYDYNDMYVKQMEEFICYVEEGRLKHKFDAPSSLESLKVVEAFFESNQQGKKINIVRNERFTF
jgi:spore coat polysaccharide biosynthesis protein SpsF